MIKSVMERLLSFMLIDETVHFHLWMCFLQQVYLHRKPKFAKRFKADQKGKRISSQKRCKT